MARMIATRTYPMVQYDRDFMSLRQLMDSLIENSFVSPQAWLNGRANFDAPALDVAENADTFVVKAALPGWKAEDVNITMEKGLLTLSGEWKDEAKSENGEQKVHFREIRQASFSRSVQLPTEVQADKAQAQFENGVLTLTVPKAEVVKPKQIKISAK